jgi:hypothetical protein
MAASKLPTPQQLELIQKLTDGFENNNKLTQTLLEEIVDSEADFASIRTELSTLKENIQSLSEIIQVGNGAASIITKIALIEQRLDVFDKWIQKQEKREEDNTEFKSVIDVGLVTIKTHLEEIKKHLQEINTRHAQEDAETKELAFEKKKTKINTAAEKHNSLWKILTAVSIALVSAVSGGSIINNCGQGCNTPKQKDKIVLVQPGQPAQPSVSTSTNK